MRGVNTKPNWKESGIFTELTKTERGIIHTRMAVRLKNRYQSAIGGFQFVDAAISPDPITDWGFNTIVDQIIARRQANPRFNLTKDRAAVEAEVDLQNALRMRSINGGEAFIVDDGGGGQQSFSAPRSARRSAVAASRAVATGTAILVDWLGEGAVPESQSVAEVRASICAGSSDATKCPQNQPGDWLAIFTEPVAATIRKTIELKNSMKLSTSYDSKLGVCAACKCPLLLKSFTPMKHILEHTSDEVKAKLDPRCWILLEK